jgi:hypothetical protein
MCPAKLEIGRPVSNLDIQFQWHTGIWKQLFDKQVRFIQQDILRALADDKLVIYLSCPLSSRAGSYFATNVEIANFTAQRLSADWGGRVWFLNPAQYQMESAQGLGLIRMHAYELGLEQHTTIDVDKLIKEDPAAGGDYMRMWTRVLAEDGAKNLGDRFSAFYFIGPADIRAFFSHESKHLSSGVESYFAQKYCLDSHFRRYFSLPLIDDKGSVSHDPEDVQTMNLEIRKQQFVRFYTVRASAYFSKGSHDEWNIWQKLNAMRIAEADPYGMGSQIAGYFENIQIAPGAAEAPISAGYAVDPGGPVKPTYLHQTAWLTGASERLAQHGK